MTSVTGYIATVYATWSFYFIDDELAEIPQRHVQAYTCKFIRKGDFYESRVVLPTSDPFHVKNSAFNHGIAGCITIREYIDNTPHVFVMISVDNLPHSEFDAHLDGNSYKVASHMTSDEFEDIDVEFKYTFVDVKRTRVLSGFEVKVPHEAMEKFVAYQHAHMKQLRNGLP